MSEETERVFGYSGYLQRNLSGLLYLQAGKSRKTPQGAGAEKAATKKETPPINIQRFNATFILN